MSSHSTAANGPLLCGFHNRLRNTRPWPQRPPAGQPDNHVETDPVFTSQLGDESEADDLVETDAVFPNEPGDGRDVSVDEGSDWPDVR